MRNIFNILGIIVVFSCKAQQTFSLNTSDYDAPNNSYFKDINNELDNYVGNWDSNFQNKIIRLSIFKEIKRPYKAWGKDFFQDILIVKFEIKDLSGNVIQSTLNNSYALNENVRNIIMSAAINLNGNNEINLVYAGGNCSVGKGEITFKKINNTEFYWSYYPGTSTRDDINCPPNLDYNIYLPETENLVFTKQ
ncbi:MULTISPECIES: DUF6705 family protein [unclassified Chryseobacterium]|uniref:DUF6705 family protein n=1 Tax=unclassified Chryseobacterium TaxID=2593645 RepID=UPI0004E605D1|nr:MULTISPECIES: DUF6705 family protein [unclassified Chryseobacterium]KFF19265.1 hypothetical protein IW22_16505 [Chryseobacterium sp. JM1]HCA05764.1 hypothetical protein [Chryseobacterium sp.]